LLTINAVDRWCLLVNGLKQFGQKPEEFTPERCREVVRQAAGVSNLDVTILGIGAWTASALVAERYREGPVFLTGDAAHEMPPTGGFGLNTGVQDVHNLVWKLAAVLSGNAGESLLDTYDAERRPSAQKIVEASYLNALSFDYLSARKFRPADDDATSILPRSEFLNEQGLIFGAHYQSSAIVSDGSSPPQLNNPVTDYVPSAHPGCRAPHVWLNRRDEQISTVDLFGKRFVLLVGRYGNGWSDAAQEWSPHVTVHRIGGELTDPGNVFATTYGVDDEGAVLVRPDGYVAWRSASSSRDPHQELSVALQTLFASRADQLVSA
jgi:hypothetical protein